MISGLLGHSKAYILSKVRNVLQVCVAGVVGRAGNRTDGKRAFTVQYMLNWVVFLVRSSSNICDFFP